MQFSLVYGAICTSQSIVHTFIILKFFVSLHLNVSTYPMFFRLQELQQEIEQLKSSYQEVTLLSKSIISFLSEVHKPSAEAIQAKLDQLDKQYKA